MHFHQPLPLTGGARCSWCLCVRRCGGVQGEDPSLNGRYGAAFISGFQGDAALPPANGSRPAPARLMSSSCAKHYFVYSLENCFVHGVVTADSDSAPRVLWPALQQLSSCMRVWSALQATTAG